MAGDTEAPEGFDSLIKSILESHVLTGDNAKQGEVLMGCMNYLLKHYGTRHCFCDKYMCPIATHALILFSFPENQALSTIKPIFRNCLSNCEKCIANFVRGKAYLRLKFLIDRSIPYESVSNFLDIIVKWELEGIGKLLVDCANSGSNGVDIQTDSKTSLAILHCFYNPRLLQISSQTKAALQTIMARFVPTKTLPVPQDLTAGTIYFAFEGDNNQKMFALAQLDGLKTSNIIYTSTTISTPALDQFHRYLYGIQNVKVYTDAGAIHFWKVFLKLFDLMDNDAFLEKVNTPEDIEVMSAHLSIKFYPIIRVFFNYIMSYSNSPLPMLIQVLTKFLVRFKKEFWVISGQFTYQNLLDSLLASPYYGKFLASLPNQHSVSPNVHELTNWMTSLPGTLKETQIETATTRLGIYIFNQANTPEIKSTPDKSKTLRVLGCKLLLQAYGNDCAELDLKSENFSINLLRRRDARAAVENNSQLIVDLALRDDMSVAQDLVAKSIKLDVDVFAHNTHLLLEGKLPNIFDYFPLLYHSLSARQLYSSKHFCSMILNGMRNMVNILKFIPKKTNETTKQMSDAISQHNIAVETMFKLFNSILEKIGLAEPNVLQAILTTDDGLLALWSCIFCPDVSQAASDILYQVYDTGVGGRLEAIQGLLSQDLKRNINSIIPNLHKLIDMSAFEPCIKAVRLLMDVIKALTDPLNGVISCSKDVQNCQTEIGKLWDSCWGFLIMIFKKTLVWAGQYHLEELIEFPRDTLDLSHMLLDSFRVIIDNIQGSTITANSLFQVFMNSFNYMIVWLRLRDTALLNSCLELVFKGFDLASELKFEIDQDFIAVFIKYGIKAKKFNNKLTEQQRSDVLSKARELDSDLVDKIIAENQTKRAKAAVHEVVDSDKEKSSTPPLQAVYKYQTQKSLGPKQQTLGRYGVVTSQAPVAPAPKNTEFKSVGLEAIRQELISSRIPSTKPKPPSAPPAAPRPAGFNAKKPQPVVGRSLNALKKKKPESDSSEEEDNTDFSDLFVESKKKAKVVEIDYQGRPITKLAQTKKIDEARREEERMRLRLNVSLKPLYTNVLKWNYNSTDDFPTSDRSIYNPTKSTYTDAKDYVKCTEPLLMLECWQGIQSVKQTSNQQPFVLLIGSRTSVDGFFDVYASVEKSVLADRKIGDSDLLVLGHTDVSQYESNEQIASYLKDPKTNTCLAKVREIKSANSDYCDVTFRVYPQGSMMGLLTPKMEIVAMKVMQMITVEREYTSLKGLQYYDLSDAIIAAKPNEPARISEEEALKVTKVYDVNKSQAKAILGSYCNEGFSLIQGPPGTGKTKTILGIVGYFLSQQMNSQAIAIPSENKDGVPVKENMPKVLICAPSNAAVDELCVRIRDGVKNFKGEVMKPRVVRLGRSDAINASVKDLTLEELVDKELSARNADMVSDPNIRVEHTKCIAERDKLREQLRKGDMTEAETTEAESKLRDVNKRRNELAKKLDEQRERVSIAYRTREIERKNIQAKILSGAQIICSTLSGSAHDFLANLSIKFDSVVIDEACQCVELSSIIPLRYGCKKCIMVGDPNQLPPTVLSQAAASLNYEQSLFVRMQQNYPDSVYLLDTQYRMHPDISKFPSAEFYKSKLHDGDGMVTKTKQPWHDIFPLTPYHFFNIVSKHQKNELSRSLYNVGEARVALQMVEKLMKIIPEDKFSGTIGIISPYKEQIKTIKDIFIRKYGYSITTEIDFNTVDGFQGQEKDIIIMSCVRASENGSVGFLSDIRRMNVALTRARSSLWILGNSDSLSRDKVWKKLIMDATARNCISNAYPGFLDRPIQKPTPSKSIENNKVETPPRPQSENESLGKSDQKLPERPEKEILEKSGNELPVKRKSEEERKSSKKKKSSMNDHEKKHSSSKNGKSDTIKSLFSSDEPRPKSHKRIPKIYSSNPPIPTKSGSLPPRENKSRSPSSEPTSTSTMNKGPNLPPIPNFSRIPSSSGTLPPPPPPPKSVNGNYLPSNNYPRKEEQGNRNGSKGPNIFINNRRKKR